MRTQSTFARMAVITLAAFVSFGIASQSLQAQTFTIIHNFTGGAGGGGAAAGLTMDRAGNLYGTTFAGGRGSCQSEGFTGCGTVFKLSQRNSQWVFSVLYGFAGGADGAAPNARIVIGPNGSLYGTTFAGGGGANCASTGDAGCGTVFNLQPPATFCASVFCTWHETQLYVFQGISGGAQDGEGPLSAPLFDQAGNIYGATLYGGTNNMGLAYQLTPSGGGYTKSTIWTFSGSSGQAHPEGDLISDTAGNIYGTTYGIAVDGEVWELTPTPSGWTLNTLYAFQNQMDGENPGIGVIFDQFGNLYGATENGGSGYGGSGGGTVFQLKPSGAGWAFNELASLNGVLNNRCGPEEGSLVMDAAGDLYGTTNCDGMYNKGNVFELSPSPNGMWTYTDLHDFQGGANDGQYPVSNLVLDTEGNLYGTTFEGGSGTNGCPAGCGVVFKITP
jgi:hypothetical protein